MAVNEERIPKSCLVLRCAAFCSLPFGLNFDFGLFMLGLQVLGLSIPAFAELAALPLGLDREAVGLG